MRSDDDKDDVVEKDDYVDGGGKRCVHITGSIEEADALLKRIDRIFEKSPDKIFNRDDLRICGEDDLIILNDIAFKTGLLRFRFSERFILTGRGECYISVYNHKTKLGSTICFIGGKTKNHALFALNLEKNYTIRREFIAMFGDRDCTIGECFRALKAIGLSFPDDFIDHMFNFINNCIDAWNSLIKKQKER